MEPNENIPKQPVRPVNPAGVGVPPRPVASRPVASRPTVRPVAPRPVSSAPVSEPKEANEPTFDNGPSVVGKKERKTGWVLALILLFIIAAGGVGFGVWIYLDSNTQKDQLNSQINDLQQQNAELQDELASSNNTTINIDANGEAVNTADYIYVGEWGMKIKVPENLNNVSYKFSHGYAEGVGETTSVTVSGVLGEGMQKFADFTYNQSGLGIVTEFSKETAGSECVSSRMVFSNDEYIYCYSHPQVLYSLGDPESDSESEASAVDAIEGMLLNAENYSAI